MGLTSASCGEEVGKKRLSEIASSRQTLEMITGLYM
jgi:hypothetical protein